MGLFDKIKKVISKIIGIDSKEPPKVKRSTRKSYNATYRNKTNEKIPKDLGKKKPGVKRTNAKKKVVPTPSEEKIERKEEPVSPKLTIQRRCLQPRGIGEFAQGRLDHIEVIRKTGLTPSEERIEKKEEPASPKPAAPRHHAQRKTTQERPKERVRNVIVGIDFGTSYTKAYYKIAQWEEGPIRFEVNGEKSFFLPSILYYESKENRLSFDSLDANKIEYFKYGMQKQELRTTGEIREKNIGLKNDADVLCSVYFMAVVIKKIKTVLSQKCESSNQYKLSINMGCPIDNFQDAARGVYDDILNAAFELSKIDFECYDMLWLDAFVTKTKSNRIGSLQTLPELFAEALWFIEQPSSGNGIYAILDIGGGTIDCATISIKDENGERKTRIYSQTVRPLGVEVLLNEFYKDEVKVNRNTCIERLKQSIVKIPSYNKSNPLKDGQHIKAVEFQTAFFTGLFDVKKKDEKYVNQLRDRDYAIPYYIFGGGSTYKWYHSIIEGNRDYFEATGMRIKGESIYTNLPDPRLIIAEQLSRPYFPSIEGFPDQYQKQKDLSEIQLFENCDYGIMDT